MRTEEKRQKLAELVNKRDAAERELLHAERRFQRILEGLEGKLDRLEEELKRVDTEPVDTAPQPDGFVWDTTPYWKTDPLTQQEADEESNYLLHFAD